MIFNGRIISSITAFCIFLLIISFLSLIRIVIFERRRKILERLHGLRLVQLEKNEDELARPFFERTIGALAKGLINTISNATPKRMIEQIESRIENAGRPYNLKYSDLLAFQAIIGISLFFLSFIIIKISAISFFQVILLSATLGALGAYLPWFYLACLATKRQTDIRKNLPDIMDLLVISVEAGSSFDTALQKVVEKYRGTVAKEFQKVLQEINFGKSRKDSLKDMAERLNVMELSSLVNAVIQSEQLGVGLGNVLRIQSNLIREKRQQLIEEQALKAPVKMLFPLIFFIFPSIFIVILGPAVLSIIKVLNR